jgi:RNA recognition motif-containing protein
MSKRIYLRNLPAAATEKEIRRLVGRFGRIESIRMSPGRGGGSCYVEMTSGADEAIQALHQTDMGGRALNVNEA